MKFKVGDKIKPKRTILEKNNIYYPMEGKIVDFIGEKDKIFPVIKSSEGFLYTVNPQIYEKVGTAKE